MIKYLYILLVLYFIQNGAYAQHDKDLNFAKHLVSEELYKDAIFVLKTSKTALDNNPDSTNYLLGWSYYKLKEPDTSSSFLLKVRENSQLFPKSHFYGSFNLIAAGKPGEARIVLHRHSFSDSLYTELQNFQLSAISLLQKDTVLFSKYKDNMSYKYYQLAIYEKNFIGYNQQIRTFRPRSKVLAGLLSTGVPGLGKIYTGKYGQGVAAFLIISSIGLVTYENYRKAGITNYKTILFGSIFTVYYIGNIWGSVISVNIRQDEFNDEIKHNILLDLHIPLHTIFD